jgi:hypothetical protein
MVSPWSTVASVFHDNAQMGMEQSNGLSLEIDKRETQEWLRGCLCAIPCRLDAGFEMPVWATTPDVQLAQAQAQARRVTYTKLLQIYI